MTSLPPGPLMIDIDGHALTPQDRERLVHPSVGGLVLFSRNYRDREQLSALCAEVHALRTPALLIAIDHEGGRVQRCRDGFTRLPAMRALGRWWDEDAPAACDGAEGIGHVLAAELRETGVDLSFAPVLDLDWSHSSVIGDRALHGHPEAVIQLAGALVRGMRAAGLRCCGKHFPGHGWAVADSHVAIPTDPRPLAEIHLDIAPYRRLPLDGVMPAHVIYPEVDARPAGFSPVWIDYLRKDVGFEGVIFTDDLSMEGASVAGDVVARVRAAELAGCDMYLVCNAPDKVDRVLAEWAPVERAERGERIRRLSEGARPMISNSRRSSGLAAVHLVAERFT